MEWITTAEAAELLGIEPSYVRVLLTRPALEFPAPRKFGNSNVFDKAAVTRWGKVHGYPRESS